jgi:hypothetical protein
VPGLGKIIVDPDQMLDLIDQMRISVPKELHESRRVLEERDLVLQQANEQAQTMVSVAREEVEARLQSSDVVRQAQERAQTIIADSQRAAQQIQADAESDAAALRKEADDYSVESLRRLLAQVDSVQASLQRYIEEINRASTRVAG